MWVVYELNQKQGKDGSNDYVSIQNKYIIILEWAYLLLLSTVIINNS